MLGEVQVVQYSIEKSDDNLCVLLLLYSLCLYNKIGDHCVGIVFQVYLQFLLFMQIKSSTLKLLIFY